MARLTVLQDTIDRTTQAAERYRADRGCIEIHGTDILTSQVRGWTDGAMSRLLLDIADDHHGCATIRCATCAAIRQGLAVSLAGLRFQQQAELERAVAVPVSWWRRLCERTGLSHLFS
jgi:hypothetical protein